jgi:ankyrin repeat protein
VELLLQNGACPDFDDDYYQTPLARAIEGGSLAVIQLFLARKAKINYQYIIVSEHIRSQIDD